MVNYEYYRIFYYVAQYRNFTRAAEVLNNNQPNITRCMNNLEAELGCRLFVRSNRGVSLTPEGERLYEHVCVAFEQLLTGEQELAQDKGLERGLITIGASETALRLLLLDRLEEFHALYPRVRLRLLSHSTPQAVSALENGLVDFSVATTPLHIKKPLSGTPLLSFREILIGGSKYAHLSSGTRTLEQIRDLPFIALGNGTCTRELYSTFFLEHGLVFRPDMEAAAMDQILPMVRHNLGIGFYPAQLAAPAIADGEVFPIPLAEPIPERTICLLVNRRQPLSIAARRLTDALTTGDPVTFSHL